MSENGRLGEVEYAELVSRVQAAVAANVPAGAAVLVVSKGDAALVDLPGHGARHFPQSEAGGYAGHHPRDAAAVVAELEDLRRRGAEYLVIPTTARWWLDFYEGLGTHLAGHGQIVADLPGVCTIFGLAAPQASSLLLTPLGPPRATVEQLRDFLQRLLPADAALLVLEAEAGVATALAPLRASGLAVDGHSTASAIVELLRRGSEGVEFLVVPRSADGWLAGHAAALAVLEEDFHKVADQRHLCRVYAIDEMKGDR
jgi:hypothetical protein